MENNIDDQVFQGKDNKSADSKLEKENNIEEEEDARAFLRERFLRTLFSIYNKPASFSMHERTQVQALFRATDIDMENFQVSDLQTPMGVVPEALLRSSDVLSFKMEFGDK